MRLARRHKLTPANPEGLLIIGIPGTGKSLTAKATSQRVRRATASAGRWAIFAGRWGQSEFNLRSVIQTGGSDRTLCPLVDEIEKGMAGSKSSGRHGRRHVCPGARHILSWIADRLRRYRRCYCE